MVTPELVTYIKNQMALGQSAENVKNILLSNGWPEADVTEALRTITGAPTEPAKAPTQPVNPEPVINVAVQQPKSEPVSPAPQSSSPVFSVGGSAPGIVSEQKPGLSVDAGVKNISSTSSPEPAIIAKPVDMSQGQSTVSPQIKTNTVSAKIGIPMKNKSDIMKIGIGIIIGIVIGLAGAFGGSAIKKLLLKSPIPSPTPTATISPLASPSPVVSIAPDLLTLAPYTNNQYKFNLSYPQTWHLDESGYLGTVAVFSESEQGGTNVNVTMATSSPKISLQTFVDNSVKDIQKTLQDYVVTSNSATTIDGVQARLVEGEIPGGNLKFKNIQLYVPSATGTYVIVTATTLDTSWAQYKPLFLKIFQTFELI